MRAVIIGGGLGGLATALRLRILGHDVVVIEKNERFGGKMNTWEKDGFRFDTGPSLLTMPWAFHDLFDAIGGGIADEVALERVEDPTHYVYADGTTFEYGSNLHELSRSIRTLDARDVTGFRRFMELGARLYSLSEATFFARPMGQPPDARAFAAMRHAPLRHGWGNYGKTVDRFFHSPYLRQLYNRYPTYVGSSPYRCPATLAVVPYLETAFGVWYIQGGLHRLVEALVNHASRLGIELRPGTEAANIVMQGGAVRAVELSDGSSVPAEIAVFNGDAAMLPALLGDRQPAKLPFEDRSLSGIVMLIGLSQPEERLPHHSVYFSADYPNEFSQIFHDRAFPDDPTVYVCVPSRRDQSVVPPSGGETLFIMANTPPTQEPWDDAAIRSARERVFARLAKGGFPDITGSIAVESIWTPRRMADAYGIPDGAIYGANSHGWRRAFLRASNRVRGVRGLYRVGGSAHPGGGTPMVLLSAKIVSDLVSGDFHA